MDAPTNTKFQPNDFGREVRPFGGRFIPLDRTDNSPHAQRASGALLRPLQQHGVGDHFAHRHHPADYYAFDAEAAQADAGHELVAAEAEGDSRPVLQRQVPYLPGNHAPLPRGWGEPLRLLGPHDRPDAGAHRLVPGVDPDRIFQTRRPGWVVGKDVHLDTHRANLCRGAAECAIPVAGPVRVRPHQRDHAGDGLRIHLDPAEDDHAAVQRSEAIGQPSDDALADAPDDRVLLVHAAQRSGPLLGHVQRYRYRDPILRNRWLGTSIPVVPQICPGGGAGGEQAIPGSPTGGVVRRWNR